jgi:hypothetical protein
MEATVMYLQIGFSDGRSVNAVLLTASPDRMRVALEDRADATELRLIDGRWTDEDGVEVSLDAVFFADHTAPADFHAEAAPMVSAARH